MKGGLCMVLERVVTIIAAQFSIDEDQLNEDTAFNDLGDDIPF